MITGHGLVGHWDAEKSPEHQQPHTTVFPKLKATRRVGHVNGSIV